MFSHSNRIFGLCVFLCSSFAIINAINIVPNKLILSYQDREIRFDCTDAQWDAQTVVIFNIAGRMVFNSSSGFLGSGIKSINATAITATQFASGLVDVNCRVNGISSGYVTIPYVAQPTFKAVPNEFNVGQTFIANCGAQVQPAGKTTFNVTFTKDSKPFALYTIVNNQATWRIVPVPEGIEATVGTVNSTSTTANVNPKTKEAAGRYGCTVSVPNGQSGLSWSAQEWNTNSTFGLAPSFVLIAVLIASFMWRSKV